MKKIKANGAIILLVLLALVYMLVEWYRPEPVDWSRTYVNSDKNPYGTYGLFNLLEKSFPDTEIESVRLPPYNLFSDSTVRGNYISIGPEFDIGSSDLRALLDFTRSGNTVFIAADTYQPAFLDSLDVETETAITVSDSLVRFVNTSLGQTRYSNSTLPPYTWFSGADPETTVRISEDLSGRTNFIRVNYGKGQLYLHSQPALFSNYYILRRKGHEYAFKALSYLPVQTLWWDEYYKQGRVGSRSVLGAIAQYPPLRWAWYLLLAGTVLYVIFKGKRRQRIIPYVEPLKNTSLEFTGVISSLYYNQRDFRDIALKKAWYFHQYLLGRYQEAPEEPLSSPGYINRLSARSGIAPAALEELFRYVEYVKSARSITEAELHTLNRQIEDFYKRRVY